MPGGIETGAAIHRTDGCSFRRRIRAHRGRGLGQGLIETGFVYAVRETCEGEDAEVEDGPELRRDVDVHGTANCERSLRSAGYGLQSTVCSHGVPDRTAGTAACAARPDRPREPAAVTAAVSRRTRNLDRDRSRLLDWPRSGRGFELRHFYLATKRGAVSHGDARGVQVALHGSAGFQL